MAVKPLRDDDRAIAALNDRLANWPAAETLLAGDMIFLGSDGLLYSVSALHTGASHFIGVAAETANAGTNVLLNTP